MNNTETKNRLQEMCNSIAQDIAAGMTYKEAEMDHGDWTDADDLITGFEYLEDALDIQYIVNGNGEYLAARILVAFGGPNIWINTQTQKVEGYWWGDVAFAPYHGDAMGIDEACRELWECR